MDNLLSKRRPSNKMHCNYIPWDINVTLQMNLKNCQYLQKESNLMTPISMFLLFKPKVLNAINKIRESEKRPDNDSILDYIIKTEKYRQISYH